MRHFFRLVYVFGLTRLISTRQQPHAQVYPLGYIVVNVCDSLSEYSLLFFWRMLYFKDQEDMILDKLFKVPAYKPFQNAGIYKVRGKPWHSH